MGRKTVIRFWTVENICRACIEKVIGKNFTPKKVTGVDVCTYKAWSWNESLKCYHFTAFDIISFIIYQCSVYYNYICAILWGKHPRNGIMTARNKPTIYDCSETECHHSHLFIRNRLCTYLNSSDFKRKEKPLGSEIWFSMLIVQCSNGNIPECKIPHPPPTGSRVIMEYVIPLSFLMSHATNGAWI